MMTIIVTSYKDTGKMYDTETIFIKNELKSELKITDSEHKFKSYLEDYHKPLKHMNYTYEARQGDMLNQRLIINTK